MWDGYHHVWGMHWGWWIFWVAVLIVAAVVLARSLTWRPQVSEMRESALDVLERRSANGEISRAEYEGPR